MQRSSSNIDLPSFKRPQNILWEIEDLRKKPASFFEKKGEKMLLELFRFCVRTVPAFRSLLEEHHLKSSSIKTIEDFKRLPVISKDSYLRRYPYLDLFPYKNIASATTISATSGSTGEPFYFPRNDFHDNQYEYEAEIFLREQFGIHKKKTLGILGFGLGIWIGGMFTYKVMNRIAQRNGQFTIIPTGPNTKQFLAAIKKFGGFYDQILLMGYPPFFRDLLDEGLEQGIRWEDYNIKILTAAEGFSEKFRQHLMKKARLKNMLSDVINIYGTVELGTMAHETALANIIRNAATKNKKLFKLLFPKATNIPTLAQYYPHITHFEEINGEIVASGYGSSIPLIRYKFNDLGGVIPFEEMVQKLKECHITLPQLFREQHLRSSILHLPFVYVYARSDFAVVFRGANIYSEEIRAAIDDESLSQYITGRFTMIRKEDKDFNQILEINVELEKEARSSKELEEKISKSIISHLLENNSEYKDQYTSDSERAKPAIVLWPHQHPTYFSRIGKQAWLKK